MPAGAAWCARFRAGLRSGDVNALPVLCGNGESAVAPQEDDRGRGSRAVWRSPSPTLRAGAMLVERHPFATPRVWGIDVAEPRRGRPSVRLPRTVPLQSPP